MHYSDGLVVNSCFVIRCYSNNLAVIIGIGLYADSISFFTAEIEHYLVTVSPLKPCTVTCHFDRDHSLPYSFDEQSSAANCSNDRVRWTSILGALIY
jgi:hypothetical protein